MGARQKSLPQPPAKQFHPRSSDGSADDLQIESVLLIEEEKQLHQLIDSQQAEIKELKQQLAELKQRNADVQEHVQYLEDQRTRQKEDSDHWRKRYFRRDDEARKLEGLLSLSEARNAELLLELAKAKKQANEWRKKVLGSTSERGQVNGHADTPEAAQAAEPENSTTTDPPAQTPPKQKRGKRKGAPGHGPQHHDSLTIGAENVHDLDESSCSDCGEEWKDMGEEVSDEIEVEVRAYRRRHRRKKGGHFCKAKGRWVSKRAKPPNRLFRHSKYGISVWTFFLNGKYALHTPVNRLCNLLKQKGLRVPPGTVAAGFRRILELIRPLIDEIRRYSREEKSHWHIDDAGWKTFIKIKDKETYNWYLWVFRSDDVCLFVLSPSRAREVPKSHLKDSVGVVSCDRLQSNRKLGDNHIYVFCWVHERRRFRQLLAAYPELRSECEEFLSLIENLFHFNKQRFLADEDSSEQHIAQAALSDTLTNIRTRIDEHLDNLKLHSELKSALTGIRNDWDGLYSFFDLPNVPPHNNPAEQALRGPKVGIKNYYGSGSKWSAELAAAMFSLKATLELNDINLETFLTEYLEACAANGGKPPPNAARFLPWHRPPPQN